jgi:hypothetical protein
MGVTSHGRASLCSPTSSADREPAETRGSAIWCEEDSDLARGGGWEGTCRGFRRFCEPDELATESEQQGENDETNCGYIV